MSERLILYSERINDFLVGFLQAGPCESAYPEAMVLTPAHSLKLGLNLRPQKYSVVAGQNVTSRILQGTAVECGCIEGHLHAA